MPGYWFLDSDHDGHWYLVLAAEREAWNAWLNLDTDDEAGWEVPSFASRINGSPSQVEFVLVGE